MIARPTTSLTWALCTASALALAACNSSAPEPAEPEPVPVETPPGPDGAPVSIIRADADVEVDPATLEPLEQRISFDEGGSDLGEAAVAELEMVMESAQMKAGGPIVLRGHTDSEGRDNANLRASENRAEAVKAWLVQQGVAENRITVIAMGEQNPARPNALPDGTPNETGRAFNRRVDLTIAGRETGTAVSGEDEPQTFVERVAAED